MRSPVDGVLRTAATTTRLARAVLAVPLGYLTVLTVAAWAETVQRALRPRRAGRAAVTRFAVLVPAHDEELVIPETLASLRALDYPPDLVSVHVVVDHCTDRTAEVAAAGGAVVHDHDAPNRGKGPALAWAIDRILDPDAAPVDALVIVDADTVVDPGMLRAFDDELRSGARVVQGHYGVRHPEGSSSAALRAAALALRHHLRPLGRTALGASCGLYGNGMAFAADVLRSRTWSEHLTEDMEFQLQLVLDGTPIRYRADARLEAEMPDSLEASRTQNERWERGRVDLATRYLPRLLRRLWSPGRASRRAVLDAALDVVVPPLSVLAAATAATSAASVGIARARRTGGLPGAWLSAALVFHVASGLVLARVPFAVVRSLAGAPRLVLWKTLLFVGVVKRRDDTTWIRTERIAERDREAAR